VSRRALLAFLDAETQNLKQAGLVRTELASSSPPGPVLRVGEREIVNLASRDYLGLSSHPDVKREAAAAIDAWGVGVASPRAAVGSIALHAELEAAIAKLLGTEDALVHASGHHAAVGLFEALFGDRDYVFCDEMMRPSLADGVRLSRARAYAYRNADLEHLEDRLKRSRAARFRVIATDGVFPITGRTADLEAIYALAAKYHAVVVVDDSEGLGVLGERGEGAHAEATLPDGIDLVTGSFGHALGGGPGGFVAGRSAFVSWLRQKSRSHLSSTALSPAGAAGALASLALARRDSKPRVALRENLRTLKDAMAKDAGLNIDDRHPAVSILVRNAILAQRLTDDLYRRGFFAVGYCHPVVPEGQARLSVRVTARHSKEHVERVAAAIGEAMRELKIQL
jgi:glycine C-acetyltransferase